MGLTGKIALVTGGSRGIGRAIVQAFARENAKVYFTYAHSKEAADKLAEELNINEDRVIPRQCDGTDANAVKELVASIVESEGKLDILVNNAGITRDNLILRMQDEQWDAVLDNNLTASFYYCRAAAKAMMRTGGSIINISSVVGIRGNAGQVNYSASKAGIIGLSKSLAQEMGSRNVRCNVIAPGFISTEMTHALSDDIKRSYTDQIPLKRFGTADDVAELAFFLASPRSEYITGQVISVCGGLNT